MDRAEYESEHETLSAIVATLLALAVLAELLCVTPHPLRVVILSFFRRAEALTRAYVVEWAGGSVALPLPLVRGVNGDSEAEALRLARSFRALASVVGGLQGFCTGRRLFRGSLDARRAQCAPALARRDHFAKTCRTMGFRAAARIDTS